MKPFLRQGDIFFVSQPSVLGSVINWAQRLLSSDNVARYNHSGIIIDDKGTTFEALWRAESHNFFERYDGKQVLIARMITPKRKIRAAVKRVVMEDAGNFYPVHRFIYLIAPPLAKYTGTDRSVCSEISAKTAYYAGVRHRYFQGTTPDKLVDEVRHWTGAYSLPFEGVTRQLS